MKCEICGKEILRDSQCINYKYYHYDCIENLQQENKKQKEVINRAVKYIENEMPYLQETDKEYEDINGNTYFTYKEYDGKELLDILKGVENE